MLDRQEQRAAIGREFAAAHFCAHRRACDLSQLATIRARTVADPNADYRSYVKSATCRNGRFRFDGLPDGGWFLITPVSAGGDRIVLMRHVVTRAGTTANVTL